MKCSVVMTTYNGDKYVIRQLDSLRDQTRQPDEVLIFDDCSTDNTVDIVRKYIVDNRLSTKWKMLPNVSNLGWKANFMQGLNKATGDILFPCDQDDTWRSDKIELMSALMESREEINVLACDTCIRYEQGSVHSKHYDGEETRSVGEVGKYPLTTRFFMTPRPGCTYAIRKSFFEQIKDYWQADFPHDEYMWIAAALSESAYFINLQLVEFYRHADNSSDIRYKDIPMQLKNLDYIGHALETYEELIKNKKITPLARADELLKEAKVWCDKRKKLMNTRNPFRWLAMAPWWKYYNSNKNALSDVFLVVFGKFRR